LDRPDSRARPVHAFAVFIPAFITHIAYRKLVTVELPNVITALVMVFLPMLVTGVFARVLQLVKTVATMHRFHGPKRSHQIQSVMSSHAIPIKTTPVTSGTGKGPCGDLVKLGVGHGVSSFQNLY